MPTTFSSTYSGGGINPFYPGGTTGVSKQSVRLPPSVVYPKGTIVGELTSVNAAFVINLGAQTSGTFTLTVGANTTTALAYNASLAAVTAAMVALVSVGAGNATTTGTVGGPYLITFISGKAATPITITGSGASLSIPGNFAVVLEAAGSATASGIFAAYASGNSDGTQIPKGVLELDCATDVLGNITFGSAATGDQWGGTEQCAPVFFRGSFATGELVGLDANALLSTVSFGWRLVSGSLTGGGVLLLP